MQVIDVVGEQVVLLRINDRLYDFSGFVSFSLEDLSDDFHDIGDDGGESHEQFFYDAGGEAFKEVVDFVQAVEGWVSELLELRLNQINENVDGGETRDRVSFVHDDCSLDVEVCVLCGRAVVARELFVKTVELDLDLGSA